MKKNIDDIDINNPPVRLKQTEPVYRNCDC